MHMKKNPQRNSSAHLGNMCRGCKYHTEVLARSATVCLICEAPVMSLLSDSSWDHSKFLILSEHMMKETFMLFMKQNFSMITAKTLTGIFAFVLKTWAWDHLKSWPSLSFGNVWVEHRLYRLLNFTEVYFFSTAALSMLLWATVTLLKWRNA